MVGLPAVGTASYNGITFDGAYQANIETEFVTDEAERTVIYLRHTLTIRAVVQANTGVNSTLEEIKAKLSKQGAGLTFISQGFGNDLMVNVSTGGPRDVKWGPKPKILRWEPAGSSQAADIEWQVETCVALCSANIYKSQGILALNYEASYVVSPKGFTTRTITGYLEIAQTRVGRSLPDCADRYRLFISPAPPVGYQREQSWDVSKDKSRIDFTITDRQIESKNAYPPGVVEIRAVHDANWSRANRSSQKIFNRLDCEIELTPGVPQIAALSIFGAIMRQRVNYSLANGRYVWLEDFSASEDIFSYRSRFSARWRVTCHISHFLAVTGMWQPLGTNWNLWSTSLANTAFHQRGISKLQLLPGNDAIVDICGGSGTIPWNPQQTPPQQQWQQSPVNLTNQVPPPQHAFLDYQMQIVPSRQRPVSRQSPMQDPDQEQGSQNLKGQGFFNFGPKGGLDDLIQVAGRSMYDIRLVGYAKRVGYEILRPVLTKVGAATVTEVGTHFAQRTLGRVFGVPVYIAAWVIDYALSHSPGDVKARADIADCGSTTPGAGDPGAAPAAAPGSSATKFP